MSNYTDKAGNPISMKEWSKLLSDGEYKRIGATTLPDGKRVSTVWLGLNYGFGGTPLYFETMVFPPDSMGALDCERYATEAEARAGHAAMVAKWEHPQ